MAERKIDALVMQNSNDFVGGYVRWFTDTPLTDGYIPRSVIFPASDLMITVDMGGKGVRRKIDGRDEGHRGVGEQLFTPAFASVAYTHEYQAEIVAAELKRRGYRTIGWVGSGAMPHKFVARVEQELVRPRAIRRCDRIHRPPQGHQERGGEGAHPQMRRDAGRGLRPRAAGRSSPA